jgi:quercetin dioxygenase-like cupin family protein
MRTELITERDDLVIRRAILEPGEATPWHVDPCRRFAVVVRGDGLTLEFRDDGATLDIEVRPGQAGWDEPEPRVHRALNTGSQPFEEVVTFYLTAPGADPQPEYP